VTSFPATNRFCLLILVSWLGSHSGADLSPLRELPEDLTHASGFVGKRDPEVQENQKSQENEEYEECYDCQDRRSAWKGNGVYTSFGL